MKLEARCGGCGREYLVDREAIDAGLPCPECGIPLEARPEAPLPDPVPRRRAVPNRVKSNSAPEISIDQPEPAETAIPLSDAPKFPEEVAVSTADERPLPVNVVVSAPELDEVADPLAASGQQPSTERVVETATAVGPAEPAERQEAAPTGAAHEVVCPRCQLHFRPRSDGRERKSAATARKTILVVEEMAYFREIAAEALGEHYEVKGVATRDGALSVLSHAHIDLMVLDPTVDGGHGGFELLRRIGHKPCPILVYTAQDESEMYGDSWEELQRFGADDIVIKGMNAGEELARKADALLGMTWEGEG